MYALVIAGGEGARLRPYTADRPKPMIAIAGKPILQRQVEWLKKQGVSDVVLLCGYRADVIQRHFGDGSAWGLRIHYSLEDKPLGRGGALHRGFQYVQTTDDLVIGVNGDIITDQPLDPLIRFHRRKNAVATIMLTPLVSPFGIVHLARNSAISAFQEKPALPHWVNAGVYVLSRDFFARLPDNGDHEVTLFPQLAHEGRLFGYRSHAYWRPIDTVKDIQEAEVELREAPAGAAKL